MIALAFKNSQPSTILGKNSNLSLSDRKEIIKIRTEKKIRTETSEVIKYRTVVNEIVVATRSGKQTHSEGQCR